MHAPPIPLHASPENAPPSWQVLAGGCYQAPRGRDFPTHAHRDWEWVYYRAGNILCRHGQETFPATPGLLWLTPPETPHAEIARTAYVNYYLAVRGPAGVLAPELPRFCLDDTHGSIGRLCGDIVRELSGDWPDRMRMLDLLTEQLWRQVARQTALPVAPGDEFVAAAGRCWTQDPAASIAQVARRVGASTSTLREHFQRAEGCSPRDYRRGLRAQMAAALLDGSPHLTLEAVAERCGYHSASHLAREIRRHAGVPPGQLRRLSS